MDKPNYSPDFKWIDKISNLLDSKFKIPGTRFRFGLDPILGLFPGVGDMTTFTISSMLIVTMAKKGVSEKVIVLMILNVVIDTIFGAIPILGNVYDFFFKANERNVRLLKKHYQEGKYQGSGKGIIIFTLISLVVIFFVLAFFIFKLIALIFNWLAETF